MFRIIRYIKIRGELLSSIRRAGSLYLYADISTVKSMANKIAWKVSHKDFKELKASFGLKLMFLKVRKKFWKYPCFQIEGKYGCCQKVRIRTSMKVNRGFNTRAVISNIESKKKTKDIYAPLDMVLNMLRNKKNH